MISGSAPCRLRWIESTLDSDCFFEALSVFQCSIRSFTRSPCVVFEVASSCVRSPFSCVIEAYDTGSVPAAGRPCVEYCVLAGAAAGGAADPAAGPDWPSPAVVQNSDNKPIERMEVRFIIRGVGVRKTAYYKPAPVGRHPDRAQPPQPREVSS